MAKRNRILIFIVVFTICGMWIFLELKPQNSKINQDQSQILAHQILSKLTRNTAFLVSFNRTGLRNFEQAILPFYQSLNDSALIKHLTKGEGLASLFSVPHASIDKDNTNLALQKEKLEKKWQVFSEIEEFATVVTPSESESELVQGMIVVNFRTEKFGLEVVKSLEELTELGTKSDHGVVISASKGDRDQLYKITLESSKLSNMFSGTIEVKGRQITIVFGSGGEQAFFAKDKSESLVASPDWIETGSRVPAESALVLFYDGNLLNRIIKQLQVKLDQKFTAEMDAFTKFNYDYVADVKFGLFSLELQHASDSALN